ncbi:MAG: ATP-binding protein [Acidobacteriota bacterium]
MTNQELLTLVQRGESELLEFKQSSAQFPRAGETLCAFMNGQGGQVLIGVRPDGSVIGQMIADKTFQELAQVLRRFDPPIPVETERIPVGANGLEVLVLKTTSKSDSLPCTYDGRPYQRVGTTTSVMPQETYQRILLERTHSRHRWENEIAEVMIDELDAKEIRRTIQTGIAGGRLPADTSADDLTDVLDRLGLRVRGALVNAAVVVFGREFLPHYPQCQLRLARFRGTDKNEFLDQRQLHGHAFDLLSEAMQFLTRHLPVAGRIEPGLFERVDEPLFPPIALREALVNAFCHRDYAQAGGAVSVAIYDDRLEIWSSGELPLGMKVEDLKREHLSRPRNPLIAEVFYRRGLVERWGRGTQKIVELCLRAGHPEPEFLEVAGAVGVRFLPSGYVAPLRVAHDLTDRQRRILQAIADGRERPFASIRAQIDPALAERTLRDDLLHLKRLGLIDSRGHGRGAVWFLGAAPKLEGGPNKAE